MKKAGMFIVIVFALACGSRVAKTAAGFLEISFQLDKVPGMEPSYQTVVWLEDQQGNMVKTLLVSEYLSYGGYHEPEICPNWSSKAHWDLATPTEFDLVTKATPPIGPTVLRFSCRDLALSPGVYVYCVQTHMVANYSILYEGVLQIGGKSVENAAEISYIPDKYAENAQALSGVRARYLEKENVK